MLEKLYKMFVPICFQVWPIFRPQIDIFGELLAILWFWPYNIRLIWQFWPMYLKKLAKARNSSFFFKFLRISFSYMKCFEKKIGWAVFEKKVQNPLYGLLLLKCSRYFCLASLIKLLVSFCILFILVLPSLFLPFFIYFL